MPEGTVKFFDQDKGFGFIKPDDGGKDVYVNRDNIVDMINDGDRVTYSLEETPKGPSAIGVRKVL